jgi:hypothetical protein
MCTNQYCGYLIADQYRNVMLEAGDCHGTLVVPRNDSK